MKNQFTHSSDLFLYYRNQIDALIKNRLSLFGEKSPLREACAYALLSGGKRWRPLIVLVVADAIGKQADVSFAAMAVECFHTASLIADDLPSMDDDDIRRERPSVHKQFGEGVALLASYALIAIGFECIAKNVETIKSASAILANQSDLLGTLALQNAAFNTGLRGAVGGQLLDLTPPNLSLETLKEVIHKKTSSLFEISFVFGWLFGGGRS